MFISRLPTIPSTTEYPGDWGFQISFGPPTESASKSATWTYSDVCKKLYVNLASYCPIKFKTHMPPPLGTVLRAVAVFKGSTNLHDIVKRCPNHMESSNDGEGFIKCNLKRQLISLAPLFGPSFYVFPPNLSLSFFTNFKFLFVLKKLHIYCLF